MKRLITNPNSKRGRVNASSKMKCNPVKSSRVVRRRKTVTAAKIYSDGFSRYTPWSGAIDTWDNLEKFDRIDALEQFIDEMYYNDELGEGVINETQLNDLLWFEPEVVYEAVGLYYDDETGEVSDEPFEDEYEDDDYEDDEDEDEEDY